MAERQANNLNVLNAAYRVNHQEDTILHVYTWCAAYICGGYKQGTPLRHLCLVLHQALLKLYIILY